jgi:hypothetical protein
MTNVAEFRPDEAQAASLSGRFAPSPGRDRDEVDRPGVIRRTAAAWLALVRADLRAPPQRPLARLRAKRNAIGFPYRATPVPPWRERDHRCDCVPF